MCMGILSTLWNELRSSLTMKQRENLESDFVESIFFYFTTHTQDIILHA
jgi:hypothetical protein